LYHNETDARIENLDGYGLSLLGGGDFRHKQDKKNIKVEFIEYRKKGETKGRKIKAIIHEPTSFAESISILSNTIKMKESKIATYLQACPEVDLVIDDASHLFRFDKYEDLFRPLSRLMNRPMVVNSRFREIFLIIKNKQNVLVRIPLKLNLFIEDVRIFEHLVHTLKESPGTKNPFLILLCCLCQSGYKDIRIENVDGGIGLVAGNYLYLYSKAGRIIRDYTTIPEQTPKGELISETIRSAGGNTKTSHKRTCKRKVTFQMLCAFIFRGQIILPHL
jgi:hypothetical protein